MGNSSPPPATEATHDIPKSNPAMIPASVPLQSLPAPQESTDSDESDIDILFQTQAPHAVSEKSEEGKNTEDANSSQREESTTTHPPLPVAVVESKTSPLNTAKNDKNCSGNGPDEKPDTQEKKPASVTAGEGSGALENAGKTKCDPKDAQQPSPSESFPKSILRSSGIVAKEKSVREKLAAWQKPRQQPVIDMKKLKPAAPPTSTTSSTRPSPPDAIIRTSPVKKLKTPPKPTPKTEPVPIKNSVNLVEEPPPKRKKVVAVKSAVKSESVPNKRKSTTAKKKTAAKKSFTKGKSGSAPLVWEGSPDESLEGGWPAGWTKRVYERMSGNSCGQKDRYWYPPESLGTTTYKLRSMAEVKRFLKAFNECGDVVEAYRRRKG